MCPPGASLSPSRVLHQILLQLQESEALQTQYKELVADLLCWIAEKQVQLEARDFPDNLPAMRQLLVAFASFRSQEKPPRLQQRGATEALLFRLQTVLQAQNRRPFLPPEGLGPAELSRCWTSLERAEASRSRALQQRPKGPFRSWVFNFSKLKKNEVELIDFYIYS